MNAKEYLNQVMGLKLQIASKKDQIIALRAMGTKMGQVLSGMPGNPNKYKSSVEELAIKLVMLEDVLAQDIDHLLDLEKDIIFEIGKIDDFRFRYVLERRYLRGLPWETIAKELNRSPQHTFRIHKEALAAFQEILDEASER